MASYTPGAPAKSAFWNERAATYKNAEQFTALYARDSLRLLAGHLSKRPASAEGARKLAGILTSAGAPEVELVGLQDGPLVLDIACGTGAFSLEVAREWPHVSVLCTDFASGMIDVVRMRPDRPKNVFAVQMDAQELRLPDSCVDIVGCTFGMMFMPDRPQAWSEMHRVLRPGGRAAVVVIKESLEATMVQKIRLFAGHEDDSGVATVAFALADPKVLESEASAAGFANVTLETLAHIRTNVEEAAQMHVQSFADKELWSAEKLAHVQELTKGFVADLTAGDETTRAQYNTAWLAILDKA